MDAKESNSPRDVDCESPPEDAVFEAELARKVTTAPQTLPVFYISDDANSIVSTPAETPARKQNNHVISRTQDNGHLNKGYEVDFEAKKETKKDKKARKASRSTSTSKDQPNLKKLGIGIGNKMASIGQGWRSRTTSTSAPPSNWRMDHETQPILDLGRSSQAHMDDALAQHRKAHVGLPSTHKQHKHHKHHKRKSKKSHKPIEEEEETMILPPSQQVQFILGNENQGGDEGMDGLLHSDGTPCLFTEMQQLKTEEDGETTWKETARWIKFEECVEEGGDRWSKPHVSTLSLHSLFELRSCIMNGVVQLGMAANEFTQITDLILEQMLSQGQLPHDDDVMDKLRAVFLSGHEHQGEKKKGVTAIKSMADFMARKDSESHLKTHGLTHNTTAPSGLNRNKSLTGGRNSSFPGLPNGEQSSFTDNDKKNKVPYFMKKIPTGAEAFTVMVGEVDFLEQRVVAFVRLQDSTHLCRLAEVPIPSRFIFVLLGPPGNYRQYHEIGRSISTLMADEVFHEVAYKAKTRKDILSGIDEFLDQVTVLPPGEWDSNIRIEPPKDLPGNQKQRLVTNANGTAGGMGEDKDEPVGHGVSTELQRTGRLFGGLINDIKRKAPFYLSDFKDCLSIQCLASFIFLYFAILTPIVTFGGLLGDATENNIGTMESIFGGAISGIAFHLFAGQPLTIIGSTGPILVFEKIMFEICGLVELDYISFRVWVGAWTGILCILLVAFDASSLISYVTRYTEESFSALISLIFIYEAFKKLIHESDKLQIWYGWNPEEIINYGCECEPPDFNALNVTYSNNITTMMKQSNDILAASHKRYQPGLLFTTDNISSYVCVYRNNVTNISDISTISWNNLTRTDCLSYSCGSLVGESCPYTPDAIFMSIILFFGTFTISMFLKGIKTTRYFPTKIRSIISDFAVTIGIAAMVVFDLLMGINTSKLIVPESFRPTRDDRTWLIDPFGRNAWWSAIVAVAPALLATILIFMDQQITAVIVNRKENKLKKGCGYHLDLFIVAIMLIICSVFGLPWFVAATVLSITHVNSLKMESETSAPGESAKFLGVREQRVTGIMIFLMIGLSVFLTPVLAYIPMPVLYGVFLYMGVSSLKGVQFFDRLRLFFMPPKHQPDFIYLRHVPLPKVYLFTAFQAIGLVILWVIKSTSPVSIIFPMMVAALVGIRKSFDYFIFSQQDLMWLDDIIPELTKKKKEDARKKKEKEELTAKMALHGPGTVDVPINGGKVLKIPVAGLKYNPDSSNRVNLSKDVSQTAIWKTLASNELGSSSELRNRSKKSKSACHLSTKQNGSEDKNLYQTTTMTTPAVTICIPDDEDSKV